MPGPASGAHPGGLRPEAPPGVLQANTLWAVRAPLLFSQYRWAAQVLGACIYGMVCEGRAAARVWAGSGPRCLEGSVQWALAVTGPRWVGGWGVAVCQARDGGGGSCCTALSHGLGLWPLGALRTFFPWKVAAGSLFEELCPPSLVGFLAGGCGCPSAGLSADCSRPRVGRECHAGARQVCLGLGQPPPAQAL